MKQTDSPDKLVLPFADAGAKNAIPAASQIGITAGAASLTDGFPPLTRTPISAGGVPPSGLDMNGILYELSAIARWLGAGAGFVYDGTFANDSDVGGYPKGARVLRTDGAGYWINTVDNNTTDPESAGAMAAGWAPGFTSGATEITMTSANVTLTPLQYGKPIIIITGTLTANLNLILPAIAAQWVVANATSGAYSITAKTASGSGVTCAQGGATYIYGNGTNISVGVVGLSASNNNTFTKAQRGAVVTLTDAATITPDFNASNNFEVTLGGNRTLANPTNITAGQSGVIKIIQDGAGSRTLAYGSYFKFAGGTAPTLTTAAGAVDVLAYYAESATRITASLIKDVK